jgi:DeoR family fructose operon transcriptional repressor
VLRGRERATCPFPWLRSASDGRPERGYAVAVDGRPTTYRSARERRLELLHLIRDRGELSTSNLDAVLDVSLETVRRDLRVLESQGLVRRAYGRVMPVESGAFETPLAVRSSINPEEKLRIAAATIPWIGAAEIVFIDEGYTTQLIAERLPDDRRLTVVTAALPIASLLAPRPNIQVIMIGGRVRGNTLGTVDVWAVEMISRLNVDLAIMGANAVTLEGGMTTPDPAVAAVKAAAVQSAARRIFIGAHHKFGGRTFVRFAEVRDFELLITGRELGSFTASRFTAAGVQLELV